MPLPPHTLHIYQKPKLGNAFIRTLPVYGYKHTISAIGGFDKASFDIALRSVTEQQQFLDQYLGNRVAIYVDNPVEAVWEGFINRMTFSAGGTKRTISLDKMANRLAVFYTDNLGALISSALVSDLNSQALYGIFTDKLDLRAQNTGTTMIASTRDTALGQRAWPKTSRIPGDVGGNGLLRVDCLGFYHVLEREPYQDATVANVTLSNYLTTLLLPAHINGTTFFDNTVTSNISTNAITIQRTSVRGDTMWERMRVIREAGDGSNYWVIGITPTDFQTGVRSLYYRVFNSAIQYTARQADGLIIGNRYGQKVDPWRVRPDAGVRITDELIGWNGVGDNPTETWMMTVDYDANSQRTIWRGDDDLTAEGVFNKQQQNKAFGRLHGALYRV